MTINPIKIFYTSLLCLCCQLSAAEKSKQDIAKEVANPLTSMTYLPLQLDFDRNIGPEDDGERMTLNVQPLTSFEINDDWNLISRTIVPLIAQDDIFPGAGEQSGFGDIVQSFFFSPTKPTEDGWIWGAGPVILAPTATDDYLGTDKWAAGPTFVMAKVDGPWTIGLLANHLSSFAGQSGASGAGQLAWPPCGAGVAKGAAASSMVANWARWKPVAISLCPAMSTSESLET